MKSSSFHNLNADIGLKWYLKMPWFVMNYINNISFYRINSSIIKVNSFIPDTTDKYWLKLDVLNSPCRMLSDLFWMQLAWVQIRKEIGNIRILDIGCGDGSYASKLHSFSNGIIDNYIGIDIHRSDMWDDITNNLHNVNFYRIDGVNIEDSYMKKSNVIISQSAMEHVEDDMIYFGKIRNYVMNAKRNIIQIHLIPSANCLKLYLLHGVRQYTTRTISKITDLFLPFSYSILFSLGGRACTSVHWEYCTKPYLLTRIGLKKCGDLRGNDPYEYNREVKLAIQSDNRSSRESPAFWALIIHSNYNNIIF